MNRPRISEAALRASPESKRGSLGRLGWGVLDQAISSMGNFFLGVFVARTLGAADLGVFALAILTYTVILNASRGLSTDPLVVRFGGEPSDQWKSAVGSASGTAALVGLAGAVLCITAGAFLWIGPNPAVGKAFMVLGIWLPGLMVQDSWRFAFFSVGRGASALFNDAVWTGLVVLGVLLVSASGQATVATTLIVYGASATFAAVLGGRQLGVRPRLGRALGWIRQNWTLGTRYLIENVSGSGAAQLRALALGAVAGLAAVGQVRAAEILVGPLLVVLSGIAQVAVPEARRWLQRSETALLRFCLGLGLALALVSATWGAAIIWLLPMGAGEILLGTVWELAYPLVPGLVVAVTAACFTVAATSGLRAVGQSNRSLRAQLIGSSLYLVAGVVGAVLWGATGAVWGGAIAGIATAILWWVELNRGLLSLREERGRHTPPAKRLLPDSPVVAGRTHRRYRVEGIRGRK